MKPFWFSQNYWGGGLSLGKPSLPRRPGRWGGEVGVTTSNAQGGGGGPCCQTFPSATGERPGRHHRSACPPSPFVAARHKASPEASPPPQLPRRHAGWPAWRRDSHRLCSSGLYADGHGGGSAVKEFDVRAGGGVPEPAHPPSQWRDSPHPPSEQWRSQNYREILRSKIDQNRDFGHHLGRKKNCRNANIVVQITRIKKIEFGGMSSR